MFFFFLNEEKKGLTNPIMGCLRNFQKIIISCGKKKKKEAKKSPDLGSVFLLVARTRQDSKKDLHHQYGRHLLLINAEDLSQKLNLLLFCNGSLDWPFTKNNATINSFLSRWDYSGVIPRNILHAHFASHHCLSTTFIITIIFMRNILKYFLSLSITYCSF